MTDEAERAVVEVLRRHVEALNAGDRKTAFSEWAENSEFVDAAARLAQGREEVEAHFGDFVRARVQMRLAENACRDLGRGFVTLRWNYSLFVPRESELRLWRSGVVTWVLDSGSGAWQVRFGQNTFEPSPEPSA